MNRKPNADDGRSDPMDDLPNPPTWFRIAMLIGAAAAGMLIALAAE